MHQGYDPHGAKPALVQHNTTQHNTTQHNTTQHNTTQNNANLARRREQLRGALSERHAARGAAAARRPSVAVGGRHVEARHLAHADLLPVLLRFGFAFRMIIPKCAGPGRKEGMLGGGRHSGLKKKSCMTLFFESLACAAAA